MLQRIILNSFYLLFLVTPLLFTPLNQELFEYNKMMFVYLMTVFIVGAWIIKMIQSEKIIFKRTPLDIPIVLFFISQVISTFISVDMHTSVWGYYSRSNGGLMSLISYLLLYYALVSNFDSSQAIKFLKAICIGGFVVALYAIPEHFGVSPSCVMLVQRFAADCWVQDVQTRVFATLGQPNWLGAYLVMILFPALYFFLTATKIKEKVFYYASLIAYYLGLTFTLSRGATLGFLGGILTFVLGYLYTCHPEERSERRISGLVPDFSRIRERFFTTLRMSLRGLVSSFRMTETKTLLIVLVSFLLVNLFFGSALTRFKFFVTAPPVPKPQAAASTQLETGGTESGQIRLIVWKGALEIWKAYPVFGSGLETFAYTYYNFRPVEHNLVSEWDFLYNKAHNEFLNYLATTGAVGFGTYMLMIIAYIVFSIRYLVYREKQDSKNTNYKILNTALLAGYISYLIQNFFGFSIVMIALLFYLYPAFTFLMTGNLKEVSSIKYLGFLGSGMQKTVYKRQFNKRLLMALVCVVALFFIFTLYRFWVADTYFKTGSNQNDAGNPGQAYNSLIQAVNLNSGEPLYRSELGYAAASAAVALETEDATRAAQLVQQAEDQTDFALLVSPANISLWRTAIRTYFELSFIDAKFQQKTLDVVNKAISLAPTDPKLLYNRALVQDQFKKTPEAVESLKLAIELKPNYRDAYETLGDYLVDLGNKDEAKKQYETVLKLVPGDEETTKKLEAIK